MIHDSRFIIQGKVIHGEHYGKKLGFPTANLDRRSFKRRKLRIKLGVWAGVAQLKIPASPAGRKNLKLKIYPAGIVIGPLDKKGLPKIEAHLIGFKGDLYGKYLNMYLNTYLRPFKKFKNAKELKVQIKKDLERIKRNIL